MRWAIALATVGLLQVSACREPEAPAADRTSAELIVVARLVDRGPPAPDCGGAHITMVMRYEVVRVIQGHYQGPTLYAVVGCPELPRTNYGADAGTLRSFEVGALHRLRLRDTPPPAGPLDIFGDPGLPRLWTVRADPEPGSP